MLLSPSGRTEPFGELIETRNKPIEINPPCGERGFEILK
jgi:hypothetical protein